MDADGLLSHSTSFECLLFEIHTFIVFEKLLGEHCLLKGKPLIAVDFIIITTFENLRTTFKLFMPDPYIRTIEQLCF